MPSSLIKSKKKLLCTQNKLSFLMVCKNKKNSPYYIRTWWWSKCKHEIIFGFNTCLKKKKKFHTTKYFLWNSVFKPFVVFPFFFFMCHFCHLILFFFFPPCSSLHLLGFHSWPLATFSWIYLLPTKVSTFSFFLFSLNIYSYLMEIFFNEFY